MSEGTVTTRPTGGGTRLATSGPWWAVGLDPGPSEQRRAWAALVVVGLGVVLLHALFAGLDRPINWDEAIHVSQVNPAIPAVFMEPHRTRGLSLLVAPVAVFDPTMVLLRGAVLLLGAAGTVAAFGVWIRSIGMAAPVAAAVYSSFWITVFYSVEVLPNHPSALLTVWLTGAVVAAMRDRPVRGQLVAVAVAMGLFAAVRPPDAVLVGVGLLLLAATARRREVLLPVAAAAGGGILGLLPWFVEGWVRFGFGPMTTVRSAGEYSVDAAGTNLLPLYLSSIETRLRCAGGCIEDHIAAGAPWELPPIRSGLFLLAAALLTILAMVAARRQAGLVLVPLVPVLPALVFYATAGGAMNQRYLLPVYALALLPPAMGVRAVSQVVARWPRPLAWSLRGAMALAIAVACLWSIQITLDRFENPSTRDRAATLGQALGAQTGRTDANCVVAARVNYPQIQYWSGCRASVRGRARDGELQPPLGELGSYVDLAAAGAAGASVYAVDRLELPEGSPLHTWERLDPEDQGTDGYVLYRHVPGAALPPPPCPPEDDGPERLLAEVLSERC